MAEYIERDALREAFIKHFDAVYDNGKLVFSDNICTAEDCEDILKLVADLPTADVVSVVRCKDCKHFNIGVLGLNWCAAHSYDELIECKENDYCSYGERRSNDD